MVGLVDLGFDFGELLGDVILAVADGFLGFASQAGLDAREESGHVAVGDGIGGGGPTGEQVGEVGLPLSARGVFAADERGGVAFPLDALEGEEEGLVVVVGPQAREEELDDGEILRAFEAAVVVQAGELEAGIGADDFSLVDTAFPEAALFIFG